MANYLKFRMFRIFTNYLVFHDFSRILFVQSNILFLIEGEAISLYLENYYFVPNNIYVVSVLCYLQSDLGI